MSNLKNFSSLPRRPWIIANFKMNGGQPLFQSVGMVLQEFSQHPLPCNLVLCPPFPYLSFMEEMCSREQRRAFALGAQNCSQHESGAFTGDVSAPMLQEVGCEFVILGHSERRMSHHEDDPEIAQKIHQALSHGLRPIVCIGESKEIREEGKALSFLVQQVQSLLKQQTHSLQNVLVAYEPLWAIGTGVTPTIEELSEVLNTLEGCLREEIGIQDPVILYGGSVTGERISFFKRCSGLSGFLVGKACLEEGGLIQLIEVLQAGDEG